MVKFFILVAPSVIEEVLMVLSQSVKDEIKESSVVASEFPKVSIIIPAYNVENYITECLLSIVKQTLKDIEIIVINDGSTDNTGELISEFAQLDPRINYISQSNSGQSATRNLGLKIAKGEYISFVDSDDWIDNHFLEKLYNSAISNDCDIAIATIIRKRKHFQKYRVLYREEKICVNLNEKIKACDIPHCCYVWNKIYKRKLLENSDFLVGRYYEDVLWLPEIIKKAKKIVTVPNINYYYRVNASSTVKSVQSLKKQEDAYLAKKFICEFFEENGLELSKKYKKLTRRIYYILHLPVLKIKEYKQCQLFYLFGILPIYKKKINVGIRFRKTKRFFLLKELDSHLYLNLFGIHLSFKKEKRFNYREASEYGLTVEKRNPQLIVSLTSFPARIKVVAKTINTLLRQTVKPDKLILWLADSQFPTKEQELPIELLKLKEYGLEIRWCEDLRSYKKLVPTLREFPNDIIVTADDDLYYQEDWLESLYNEYLKDPKNVYTRRSTGVLKRRDYVKIIPHYDNENYAPSYINQIMGGAGTLYSPNSLHRDVLDTKKCMNLIPTYDDIYFWAMAVANGTKIGLIKNKDLNLYNVEDSQEVALCKINNSTTMTDKEAFCLVFEEYPQILDRISHK